MKTIQNKLLLFLCFVSIKGTAQTYEWAASFPSVPQTGFYTIPLPPKVLAASQLDGSDIRIYDNKGTEVPYLARKDQFTFDKRFFSEYKTESKEVVKGCCTEFLISNNTKKELSNFCLLVKNHEVYKSATLSGSDDKENWYALRNDITFAPTQSTGQTFGTCHVSFPLSNYAYFQLRINDSSSAPLNVLQIGEYSSESQLGKLIEIPSPTISQTDSTKTKRTYVHLLFDAPYVVEKLALAFEGTKFFERNASLYQVDYDKHKNRQLNFLQSFQISSKKSPSTVLLNSNQHTEYVIEIENGDNPVLRLQKVEAYQLNTYLSAYLVEGRSYTLKIGSKKAKSPQYDLSAFADSIPSNLPELKLGSLTKQSQQLETGSSQEGTLFKTKWWIWTAITVVIGLLVWMSARMLKEMKNS